MLNLLIKYPSWNHQGPWHFVNFLPDKTYWETPKNPEGDLLMALTYFENVLRNKDSSKENKYKALKFLIHLMGDLHQPFHLGLKSDRGGNDLKVIWFKNKSNLHRVWDEQLIDFQELSHSELATLVFTISQLSDNQVLTGHFLEWANESRNHLKKIQEYQETNLGFEYTFLFKNLLYNQLKNAGLRLASIINRIAINDPFSENELETIKKMGKLPYK